MGIDDLDLSHFHLLGPENQLHLGEPGGFLHGISEFFKGTWTLGVEVEMSGAVPEVPEWTIGFMGGVGIYHDTEKGWGIYITGGPISAANTIAAGGIFSGDIELGHYRSLSAFRGRGPVVGFMAGDEITGGLNVSGSQACLTDPFSSGCTLDGVAIDLGIGAGAQIFANDNWTGAGDPAHIWGQMFPLLGPHDDD